MSLRRSGRSRTLRAILAAVLVTAALVVATRDSVAADISLTMTGLPKNLFGGAAVNGRVTIKGKYPDGSQIAWSLEAIQHRILTRGEVQLPAESQEAAIRLQFPPVKDGVILPLQFRASLLVPGQAAPLTTVEQKLWLFPESPWVDRQELLQRQKITLFDPVNSTSKLLAAAGVPCSETSNVAALGELSEGFILVGEGVDFREYPDLYPILMGRAAAGRTVICLAPAAGTFSIKEDANRAAPTGLSFRREDVIAEFDPRLDADFWQNLGPKANRGLSLRGEGADAVLEVTDEKAAWPWFELRFGPDSGRLIVCGFGLSDGWNRGPTPRFLLAHLLMLQPLAQNQSQNSPIKANP